MKKILIIITPIISTFIAIFIYAVLHEGGHALAAILQGGGIINFDVNILTGSPHVVYSGEFSNSQRAVLSIAGPLLPFFVWLILVPFLKRLKPVLIQLVASIYSFTFLGTFVALIVIPIVHVFGGDVASEDLVKFIQYTGINPFVLSSFFLMLLAFSVWYFVKIGKIKEIIENLIEKYNLKIVNRKKKLRIFVAASTVLLCIMIALNILYTDKNTIPKGYDLRLQTNFSEGYENNKVIYSFLVEEIAAYDFIYSIKTKSPVNITLINENEEGFVFNNKNEITIYNGAENIRQGKFTGFLLEPGEYSISLNTEDKNGDLDMYIYSNKATDEMMEFLRIQRAVNDGTFDEETYKDDGFILVYSGNINKADEHILYNFEKSGFSQISFFAVGDSDELELAYLDKNQHITIIKNFNSTIGFGIEADSGGKLVVSSPGASGKMYLYLRLPQKSNNN